MNARERQMVVIGAVLAGFILLYLLVLRPLNQAVADADSRIETRTTDLAEMRTLAEQVRELRSSLPAGTENVNLLSYLEGLTRQAGVQSNIEYMKPGSGISQGSIKRESIELKLAGVNLKQMTNLLFQVERGGRYPLKVDELHVKKRFDNPELLDVTVEVYQG